MMISGIRKEIRIEREDKLEEKRVEFYVYI